MEEICLEPIELDLFIDLWLSNRCLWNFSDPAYKNNAVKDRARQGIADAFSRNWTVRFRLHFSFHKTSSALPRLAGGKWNCSVPQWPEYEHHFPCDLFSNCLNHEDEANCPYVNDQCGRGEFFTGNSCYSYTIPSKKKSWNEAAADCRLGGGQLISFNTPKKWTDVTGLVSKYRQRVDFYIGLRTSPGSLPFMYRRSFMYSDGSIAYYVPMYRGLVHEPSCAEVSFNVDKRAELTATPCDMELRGDLICEFPRVNPDPVGGISLDMAIDTAGAFRDGLFVSCPLGHRTHTFLACDEQSACWGMTSSSCSAPLVPLPPSFVCLNGLQQIPYSLTCDFRPDCRDGSDEAYCDHLPCRLPQQFECLNRQCVPYAAMCNEVMDCIDGSDETQCTKPSMVRGTEATGPFIVRFSSTVEYSLQVLNSTWQNQTVTSCPATYFYCPSNDLCLPIFTRCNGVYDCPEREDEEGCGTYRCPGFYRCRASRVCIHPDQLCDGMYHCPQYDDEHFCGLPCPENCTCYGLAFFCPSKVDVSGLPALRYLDASGSGMGVGDVANNSMLAYLSLARCNVTQLAELRFHNLHSLDLTDNHLTRVTAEHLRHLPNLRHLALAANPLTSIFEQQEASPAGFPQLLSNPLTSIFEQQEASPAGFPQLLSLDLSGVSVARLNVATFSMFPSLQDLNLMGCGVDVLFNDGPQVLTSLRSLDLRGCPVTFFPPDLFQGLELLSSVSADNYKLCCPAMLPSTFNVDCSRARTDEISSCENLLRSDIYRAFLALFAAVTLLGNLITFFCRVCLSKVKNGFDILIITLCMSDFLMGVYLAIIGVADRMYMGSYLWEDVTWRRSATCKMAGFLSMVSNEVSAIIVCLITLDRFLACHFPLSRLHFTRKNGLVAAGMAWFVGLCLAAVPLLPAVSHWQFYGLNSICVPLPITREDFPGHGYAFGLLIVFNFVLFVLIAVGQALVYWAVQKNSMSYGKTEKHKSSRDYKLARRLVTIAVSAFLCWFPLGVLGLLAASGVTAVSSEVNVTLAVFIMPLNSAINPFLYTLNALLERRKTKQEDRLKQFLLAQMKAQSKTCQCALSQD